MLHKALYMVPRVRNNQMMKPRSSQWVAHVDNLFQCPIFPWWKVDVEQWAAGPNVNQVADI